MAEKKEKKNRGNLLFNDLHFFILSKCEYSYAHKICKQTQATWSTVFNVLKEFNELGLITKTKQGRSYILELTDKGKELVKFYKENLMQLRKSE